MRLALLALLLSCAATASVWDFESAIYKDRQALRTAADTAGSEVRYLTQLALEQEKISLLKHQVDLGVAGASDAADRARTLNSRCQEAWTEVDDAIRGAGPRRMPEKVVAAESAALNDLSTYWTRLNQSLGNGSPNDGSSTIRSQATQALADAKADFDVVDPRIRAMKDDLEQMQSRYHKLNPLKDDIQKAAGDISDSALAMQNQAPPTKSGIDALGTPPENEKRTAASQKIDDFRSPLGTLTLAASTLYNRTDDFSRHWISFEKSLQDFNSNSDSNDADLNSARRSLDLARDLIDQWRISQQNAGNR